MAPKCILGLAILLVTVASIPLPGSGGSDSSSQTSGDTSTSTTNNNSTWSYDYWGPGSTRKRRAVYGNKGGLGERQVSTNCRTVVAVNVNDPWMCSRIKMGDLLEFDPVASPTWGQGVDTLESDDSASVYTSDFDELDSTEISEAPGRCRYDPYRARIDPNSACLCVATRNNCEYGRDGCCWHEDRKTGYSECISKAEKFYNQLYELLRRRGKKSFAIKIRYGATGARGELPLGPHGPAIIGMGNPTPSKTYGVYKNGGGSPGGYGGMGGYGKGGYGSMGGYGKGGYGSYGQEAAYGGGHRGAGGYGNGGYGSPGSYGGSRGGYGGSYGNTGGHGGRYGNKASYGGGNQGDYGRGKGGYGNGGYGAGKGGYGGGYGDDGGYGGAKGGYGNQGYGNNGKGKGYGGGGYQDGHGPSKGQWGGDKKADFRDIQSDYYQDPAHDEYEEDDYEGGEDDGAYEDAYEGDEHDGGYEDEEEDGEDYGFDAEHGYNSGMFDAYSPYGGRN